MKWPAQIFMNFRRLTHPSGLSDCVVVWWIIIQEDNIDFFQVTSGGDEVAF